MASYLCNIAKGRVVEFYNRVKSNDPTNSAIILVPVSASGVQETIVDADTLAAALASATERTSGGWVRKTLTDSDLASLPAPDDTNDCYDVSVPQVTWVTPTVENDTTGLIIAYDSDTSTGTDSAIIPIGHWDFAITTNGNDVVLNAGVFFRARERAV